MISLLISDISLEFADRHNKERKQENGSKNFQEGDCGEGINY
jgi:hypothetical protein